MDTYTTAEQYALRMIRIAAAERTGDDGQPDPDQAPAIDQIADLAAEATARLGAPGLACLATALARHASYGYTLAAHDQGVTVDSLVDRMALNAIED